MFFTSSNLRKIFIFSLFLVFSCFIVAQAQQENKKQEELKINTPRNTIWAFLTYLQSDNYHPSVAAKTLDTDQVKDNKGNVLSHRKKEELARKLLQILDGKGLFVIEDALPDDENYVDTTTGLKRYILFKDFPDIYVEKTNSDPAVWLFSKHTVRSIDRLHKQVYPLGLDQLVLIMPQGANRKFLGMSAWQYIGLVILLLLAFLLHRLLSIFLGSTLLQFTYRLGKADVGRKLVQPVARPLSLFILFWLLTILIPPFGLPAYLNKFILLALNICMHVFAIIIALRLVDFFSGYLNRMAAKTEGTLDDQLMPLLRKTVKILIVIIGIIYILQFIKVDVTTLIAGLSIGTLAFALAAQDTIKNLFGSITIFLDRPFQVGDWVTGDGFDGSIEEVGFRSTRIRTFHNSLIYIPNGKLADMTIDNMGLRRFRRFRTVLSVTYDTPPALIKAFIKGVKQIIINHPDTRKDYYHVYLNNFAGSSLDILFYAFFQVPTWGDELRARQEVMLAIIELANELGVRFAFPTQTVHIEDLPGQKSLTPQYSEEILKAQQLDQQIDNFIQGHFKKEG